MEIMKYHKGQEYNVLHMLKKTKSGWSIESALWDEAVVSGKGRARQNLKIMLIIFICREF